jgi:NAD(P)-dependent dehydrogenase (short-subunit alcohol dehydrogenase family)
MRNPEKDTELKNLKNVTLLPLDVTNTTQIDSTVKQTLEIGDVDVVFNNAGYGLVGPMEGYTDAQIVRQIDTNLMGVLRVTKAFIPYFREKRQGLFITTTSMGGLFSFPLSPIYHATKWALEGWSESMSFELGLHNIGIKTIAPGGIVTDFMNRSLEVVMTHPAYEEASQKLMSLFNVNTENFSTADQIAAVVYEAATDGKDQVRYVAGEDAKALYAQRNALGNEAFRGEMRKMVFGN